MAFYEGWWAGAPSAPRHGACPGPGPRALWQAALGHAVRTRHHPRRARVRDKPPPRHPAGKDPYLAGDPDARAYFYQADGTPKTAGTRLTNPALARVLRTLASDGPDAFYRGPVAEAMVAKVHAHPTNPGC